MKKESLDQKGIVHIILLLAVVVIAAVAIWFLFSNGGLEIGKTSMEDKIASLQPKPFKDVSSDNKNYAAIKYLAREGVVEADDNGNFNPKATLTKGEWAVMLVKLAGVTPDQSKYRNCYADVGQGEVEAAICYAKEQGWFEDSGASENSTSWNIIKAVQAQDAEESFNSDQPIMDKEAAGSLVRVMEWAPGETLTDEQALALAKEKNILVSGGSELTKGEAAELTYRSLATIPFNQEEYAPEIDRAVNSQKVVDLLNTTEAEKPPTESELWARKRDSAIRYFAEGSGIGYEAATEIVDNSSSYNDALRRVREYRYEQWLQDRTYGDKTRQSVNVMEGLQQLIANKNGEQPLNIEDVSLKRISPTAESRETIDTTDPVLREGESLDILIVLDKDYRMIPRGSKDGSHLLTISTGDMFLWDNQLFGYVFAELINIETGIVERLGESDRNNYENFNQLLNDAVNDLESLIGRKIEPPKKSEPKSDKSKLDEFPPLADDSTFPRLYFDVVKSDLPKYEEICPSVLFYPGDNLLACGDASAEPGDLINLVNQWRSGAIPGPDGRYNTVDGQPLTFTPDIFWECIEEISLQSQGTKTGDQLYCECNKRLGPQSDAWAGNACERVAAGGNGESGTPSSGYITPDSPDTPWVEPR